MSKCRVTGLTWDHTACASTHHWLEKFVLHMVDEAMPLSRLHSDDAPEMQHAALAKHSGFKVLSGGIRDLWA